MDIKEKIAIALLVLTFVVPLLAAGLIHPKLSGSHIGYVTAIDNGWLCVGVYYKTDSDSSQEDVYSISKDNFYKIEEDIREVMKNKENIELEYANNNWSFCGREITGIIKLTK